MKGPLESWETLVAELNAGGTRALAALDQLMELRTDEIDAAIRGAAARHADSRTRAAACLAIATRGDRAGAPAVIEALRIADRETRSTVASALRTLARGEPVPTNDAARALEWWRMRFPEDFRR